MAIPPLGYDAFADATATREPETDATAPFNALLANALGAQTPPAATPAPVPSADASATTAEGPESSAVGTGIALGDTPTEAAGEPLVDGAPEGAKPASAKDAKTGEAQEDTPSPTRAEPTTPMQAMISAAYAAYSATVAPVAPVAANAGAVAKEESTAQASSESVTAATQAVARAMTARPAATRPAGGAKKAEGTASPETPTTAEPTDTAEVSAGTADSKGEKSEATRGQRTVADLKADVKVVELVTSGTARAELGASNKSAASSLATPSSSDTVVRSSRLERERTEPATAEASPLTPAPLTQAVPGSSMPVTAAPVRSTADTVAAPAESMPNAPTDADPSGLPGTERVTLLLSDDPAGARLHVTVRGAVVDARLVTADPAEAHAFRAGAGELRDALAGQGFAEGRVKVQDVGGRPEVAASWVAAAGDGKEPRAHSDRTDRSPERHGGADRNAERYPQGQRRQGRSQQRSPQERER